MYKMSLVALASLSVLVVMASSQPTEPKQYYEVANPATLFDEFVKNHNKQYKDDQDKDLHYHAFVANLEKINKLNKESPSATFGINKFADYTAEDTQKMRGFRAPAPKTE